MRPYVTGDAPTLVALFRASVHCIASGDYNDAQLRAWAPDQISEKAFAASCAAKSTWIVQIGERVAGFSDLEVDGHINMLYVHPDFQRRGVARVLLERVELLAGKSALPRLYTESNITARPAFENAGFEVIVPQMVTVRGETMLNYRMEKWLVDGSRAESAGPKADTAE